jgi:hypothetical protein
MTMILITSKALHSHKSIVQQLCVLIAIATLIPAISAALQLPAWVTSQHKPKPHSLHGHSPILRPYTHKQFYHEAAQA